MSAALEDLRHCPGWPLMLSDEQAAQYLGLSKEGFRQAVAKGVYPLGLKGHFGKRVLWHRLALDKAAARLAGLTPVNDQDDDEGGIPDEEWAAWSPSKSAIRR